MEKWRSCIDRLLSGKAKGLRISLIWLPLADELSYMVPIKLNIVNKGLLL
jgi:hypothetical protein